MQLVPRSKHFTFVLNKTCLFDVVCGKKQIFVTSQRKTAVKAEILASVIQTSFHNWHLYPWKNTLYVCMRSVQRQHSGQYSVSTVVSTASAQWSVQRQHIGHYSVSTVVSTASAQWSVQRQHSGEYNVSTVVSTASAQWSLQCQHSGQYSVSTVVSTASAQWSTGRKCDSNVQEHADVSSDVSSFRRNFSLQWWLCNWKVSLLQMLHSDALCSLVYVF
jgi:hypothetical protein